MKILNRLRSSASLQASLSTDNNESSKASDPLLRSTQGGSKKHPPPSSSSSEQQQSKKNKPIICVVGSLLCVANNASRKLQLEEDNLVYSEEDTSHGTSSSLSSEDDLLGTSPAFVSCSKISRDYVSSTKIVSSQPKSRSSKQFSSPPHSFSDDFAMKWILAGTNSVDHHPEVEVVATSSQLPVSQTTLKDQHNKGSRLDGILQSSNNNNNESTNNEPVLRRPSFLKSNPDFEIRSAPKLKETTGHKGTQRPDGALTVNCSSSWVTEAVTRTSDPTKHGSALTIDTNSKPNQNPQHQHEAVTTTGTSQQTTKTTPSSSSSSSKKASTASQPPKKKRSHAAAAAAPARMSAEEAAAEAKFWKQAVDAKSGRSYWYHRATRETQWARPLCCASPEEREAALRKQEQTRDFFAAMEANILNGLAAAGATTSSSNNKNSATTKTNEPGNDNRGDFKDASPPTTTTDLERPTRLVRTISSMEDSVLQDLVQRVPSHRQIWESAAGAPARTAPVRKASASLSRAGSETLASIREAPAGGTPPEPQEQQPQPRNVDRQPEMPQRRTSLEAPSFLRRSGRNSWATSSAGMRSALMNLVLEGENEDASSSTHLVLPDNTNETHYSSSDDDDNETVHRGLLSRSQGALDLVGNRSSDLGGSTGSGLLSRSQGTLNLAAGNRSGNVCTDSEDDNTSNNDAGEDDDQPRPRTSIHLDVNNDNEELFHNEPSMSLASLVNDAPSSREVSREPSLTLAALQTSSFNNKSDPSGGGGASSLNFGALMNSRRTSDSMNDAVRGGERWSFLSNSTSLGIGLSSEEGEAIMELAAITQEMTEVGNSSSSASSSSENSLDGLHVLSAESSPGLSADDQKPAGKTDTSRPPLARPRMVGSASLRVGPSVTPLETKVGKPRGVQRRNTCGTLYVGSTMSAPDKDATIKCVCGVFRAHILQSEMDGDTATTDEYAIFNDLESLREKSAYSKTVRLPPPTLDEITMFYRDVFGRAQMEADCIIMTIIYVERLIKVTDGLLRPRTTNWRSILFSCMVLSSKVWDDMSMWNADFSQTSPAGVEFTLRRVNELELAVLSALKYKVKVPASEYAKYYFLLRSMLIKSGLGSNDLATMNPLDVEGAKQLQHISAQYQSSSHSGIKKTAMGRAKTVGATLSSDSSSSSPKSKLKSEDETSPVSPVDSTRNKVGLEHLIQM